MRIVLDLQGAQSESRFRGIGRYTLSLGQAIARNCGKHEILVALNGQLPDAVEAIRAAFEDCLPQKNIHVWRAPGPLRESAPGNDWRREVAERIREAFLASLRPDVVHVSSLFEGYVDDAATSVGVFSPRMPTAITFYDLIPLRNPDDYLKPNPVYERHYRRKIEHLKRAHLWLAISESAKLEACHSLGLDPSEVVSISSACDSSFRPLTLCEAECRRVRSRFGITQPFVLYCGGADRRKNLTRLVSAYAQLPKALRDGHQLVLAGKISEGEAATLRQTAQSSGVRDGRLVLAGYVTNSELVKLYNLCTAFVLPSIHEGFGLPALEAMSCGAAVIGANTTSVPEVVNRLDALFDPYDETSIMRKLAQVLGDSAFRTQLAIHGLEQAGRFSWDESARRALAAFARLCPARESSSARLQQVVSRPKLAFVSPLPPERTGIADYSAELLPELARHYDIEVVVAQELVGDDWVSANCPIRNAQWLRANAYRVDRVLYQMGNSPFHRYMLDLVQEVPGTVVLHDFFLSGLIAYLEEHLQVKWAWTQHLYEAHGYSSVRERYRAGCPSDIKKKYPVNLQVLQYAQGVIVHSEYARRQAREWYGADMPSDWVVIPLLRKAPGDFDRDEVRAALGFDKHDFVVCSFGFLDPTKLNHRLLRAWMDSRLSRNSRCVLAFVGENHGGEYGARLRKSIHDSGLDNRIRITGWADMPTFRNYLAAADMAVQLRTLSRGETSASVLDCMNYALPTIVNAHGSTADLSADLVRMLPDAFEDHQLVEALENLWKDGTTRSTLGRRAQQTILTQHAPDVCARQYVAAIERFHHEAEHGLHALLGEIAEIIDHRDTDAECRRIAQAVAQSLPLQKPCRQFLLDISATVRTDLKTGIERVALAVVRALLLSPPAGYRVEPVYLSKEGGAWHYRYARRYTLGLLECPADALTDETVDVRSGDVLVGLDLSGDILVGADAAGLFTQLRDAGVAVYFVVFDLLPVRMPRFFPPGADEIHARWLQSVVKCDGAICISRAVAADLKSWIEDSGLQRLRLFGIGSFDLGADLEASARTCGLPSGAELLLEKMKARPSFLMVGTIEPRKGHLQTLDAFTQLWSEGVDANLVIVGKEGWKGLPEKARRTIPKTVHRLRGHPELGKRLFWLEDVGDECLEKLYIASTCLIAASEGEGFGLPLIEAGRHGVPVLARDIPVFREVAGEFALFFRDEDGADLAATLRAWLMAPGRNTRLGKSKPKALTTWKHSADSLVSVVIGGQWSCRMVPTAEIAACRVESDRQ